eukprot:jgi/Mesen1/10200/ME000766S09567
MSGTMSRVVAKSKKCIRKGVEWLPANVQGLRGPRRAASSQAMGGDDVTQPRPLIAGLPDDLAAMCLARVPRLLHAKVAQVCRGWRSFVQSEHCYRVRKMANQTDEEEDWLHELALCEWREGASRLEVAEVPAPRPRSMLQFLLGPCSMGGSVHKWEIWVHAGRVFKMSGLSWVNGRPVSILLRYDDQRCRWALCAPMKVPRHSYAYGAYKASGYLYIVGGYGGSSGTKQLHSGEMYDPWNDKWYFVPVYAPGRALNDAPFTFPLVRVGSAPDDV